MNPDSDGDGLTDGQEVGGDVSMPIDTDDNDGIPDGIEAGDNTAMPVDTDGDGTPDYLDLDSDFDGIPDSLEAIELPALAGEDVDDDGIDDSFDVDQTGGADTNMDGVDDALTPVDTDMDGLPDYVDNDSDNDLIPDAIENDSTAHVDTDDDGIADLYDVDQTEGTDADNDGIDDGVTLTDTDGDGALDHLDIDADNDSIPDSTEAVTPATDVTDTDGDQILDIYDVDQTGGTDANGDGIDDATTVEDTDADTVPDYKDLDSDNDSLSDINEASTSDLDSNIDGMVDDLATQGSVVTPDDSDADGKADYREVDSDNDSVYDIEGTSASDLDTNGDGVVDDETDTEGDGAPDLIDGNPSGFGLAADLDLDGILDDLDLDDDNDGIPDLAEGGAGGIDTDGDGVIDSRDLDSDNDGIPDSTKLVNATDLDGDGVVDNMVDSNGDGLHDPIAPDFMPFDQDGDATADFRDLDSDGDTLFDLTEAASDLMIAQDLDGDNDGVVDLVNRKGLPPMFLSPVDVDNDGDPDFRDLDSDGDDFADAQEGLEGFRVNSGARLETSVSGSGGSVDWFLLPLLLLVALGPLSRRAKRSGQKQKLYGSLLLIILSAGLSVGTASANSKHCATFIDEGSNEKSFVPCWYGNLGLGLSQVEPEGTDTNGWYTPSDGNDSSGWHLTVGKRFSARWFAELKYADLGAAELTNDRGTFATDYPNAAITYQVPSLMAGFHLLTPGDGFNVFAKAGVAAITTAAEKDEGSVFFEEQTSAQLALGLGAQYDFSNSPWHLRLDLDSYDRDAKYAGLSLGRYFGGKQPAKPVVKEKPKPVVKPPEPKPVVKKVSEQVCKSITLVAKAIQFQVNKAELTAESRNILDSFARDISGYSQVSFEIQAHTDSDGSDSYNLNLSDRRAESVMRYLLNRGIRSQNMTSRGYGESNPIASNNTRTGKARNRRVEFKLDNPNQCAK